MRGKSFQHNLNQTAIKNNSMKRLRDAVLS